MLLACKQTEAGYKIKVQQSVNCRSEVIQLTITLEVNFPEEFHTLSNRTELASISCLLHSRSRSDRSDLSLQAEYIFASCPHQRSSDSRVGLEQELIQLLQRGSVHLTEAADHLPLCVSIAAFHFTNRH